MVGTFESDVAALADWWASHASCIGQDVRGLWFGLFDLLREDGGIQHTMYVSGTPEFKTDDGGEWACDYVWLPDDRYLQLDALAGIDLEDWQRAVEHAVFVVAAVKPWETGPTGLQGVGVGFDDGDVHIVWSIS